MRLESVLAALGGDRNKLVVDLSCRRADGSWFVAMDKWQTITEVEITKGPHRPFRIEAPSAADSWPRFDQDDRAILLGVFDPRSG